MGYFNMCVIEGGGGVKCWGLKNFLILLDSASPVEDDYQASPAELPGTATRDAYATCTV
jgi:hypothetical protein